MRKSRIVLIGMILLCISLLTACEGRGLPSISPELLASKKSVLFVTSPNINPAIKTSVETALPNWREAHQITYDWMQDMPDINEDVKKKMKEKTYDYIYVIGNDLVPSAVQASTELTQNKWTLLQDQANADNNAIQDHPNLVVQYVDTSVLQTQVEAWVESKIAARTSIEWVTTASKPIPSAWAPSEEADHIVLLDNNPEWLKQLKFQISSHRSEWVVLYAPADASVIQKLKAIGTPVMNVNASTANLNWDEILKNSVQTLSDQAWKSGKKSYNANELKELKLS
ncbi:hypothetical protein NV379_05575 [Paenibacillus sp. N1-5-1-14]|uniref:hypothetical protein n=1 Tax=Paenibacillus radicibacter TaxID=2972488 RepID=UPI002158F526|nr:hypothetical protein [Paenibacillus radicibacter]MCR8642123.1 hypothetical protein [Paenibacillus radicibacter]